MYAGDGGLFLNKSKERLRDTHTVFRWIIGIRRVTESFTFIVQRKAINLMQFQSAIKQVTA